MQADQKEADVNYQPAAQDMLYQRQQAATNRIVAALRDPTTDFAGIQEALQDGFMHIKRAKDKDLILVLGATGVGKSVLINYLKGCDFVLQKNEDMGRKFVSPIPGHEDRLYAKPGEDPERNTYYPRILSLGAEAIDPVVDAKEESNIHYCDCPGYFNANPNARTHASRLLIQQAIQKSGRIRGLVMCVSFSLTDTKNRDIRDLLKIIDGMFKDPGKLNVPIIFVATKAGRKNTRQFVNNIGVLRQSKEDKLFTKKQQQEAIAKAAHDSRQQPVFGNLPTEIAELGKEIHLLKLMTVDSSLVITPTDGGVSRQAFRQKLDTVLASPDSQKGIDKGVFHISQSQGDQLALTRTISTVIDSAIELARGKTSLEKYIGEMKTELDQMDRNIKTTEDHIKALGACATTLDTKKTELSGAEGRKLTAEGEETTYDTKIGAVDKLIAVGKKTVSGFDTVEDYTTVSDSRPAAERPGFWETLWKGVWVVGTPLTLVASPFVALAEGKFETWEMYKGIWASAPEGSIKLEYTMDTPFEITEKTTENCRLQESTGTKAIKIDNRYCYRAVYVGNDPYEYARAEVQIRCARKYKPGVSGQLTTEQTTLTSDQDKRAEYATKRADAVKDKNTAIEDIKRLKKEIAEEEKKSKDLTKENASDGAPTLANDQDVVGAVKTYSGFHANRLAVLKEKKLALESEIAESAAQIADNEVVFRAHGALFTFGLEMAKLSNYDAGRVADCRKACVEYGVAGPIPGSGPSHPNMGPGRAGIFGAGRAAAAGGPGVAPDFEDDGVPPPPYSSAAPGASGTFS